MISGKQLAAGVDRKVVTGAFSTAKHGHSALVRHAERRRTCSSVKASKQQCIAVVSTESRPVRTTQASNNSVVSVTFRVDLEVAMTFITFGNEKSSLRGGQQQSMDSLIELIQSNVAPDCGEFAGTVFPVGQSRKRFAQ